LEPFASAAALLRKLMLACLSHIRYQTIFNPLSKRGSLNFSLRRVKDTGTKLKSCSAAWMLSTEAPIGGALYRE
jgi:hypothetical protein